MATGKAIRLGALMASLLPDTEVYGIAGADVCCRIRAAMPDNQPLVS